MGYTPHAKFGASLGAWRPSDVLSRVKQMAEVADATTIYPYPWNLPVSRGLLHDIRRLSGDLGLMLLVHGPCWEVYTASVYPDTRALGVEAIKRAIDFASAIGARHITVHPGPSQWPDVWPHMEQRAQEAQAQSLLELSEYAARADLQIGIENMPRSDCSLPGYVDFTEIYRALQMAPSLGVTLDVAHVHTAHFDLGEIIRRLGARINHVHVTDNHGDFDSHSPIGEGTIRWEGVASALLAIAYRGVIEVERSLADGGVRSSLDALKEAFDRAAAD